MANVTLLFNGSEISETKKHELVCYANDRDEIFIRIDQPDLESSFICLDRATAIKFHKNLKREISYLSSEEVQNG